MTPRSYVCLCGHVVGVHTLYRDQLAPGTPYHWGACLTPGCDCRAAINETGTITERPKGEPRVEAEHVLHERARVRADLERGLAYARRAGEAWVTWIEKRQRGEHDHGAIRNDGTPAACPVPGCDAMHESGML